MNTKLKTEIENLEEEIDRPIKDEESITEFNINKVLNTDRLSQTQKCINIFKEIINDAPPQILSIEGKVLINGKELTIQEKDKFVKELSKEWISRNKLKSQLEDEP